MKIYRFEHNKKQTGMFSTDLNDTEFEDLQRTIRRRLMNHFNEYPDDLRDPKVEFASMISKRNGDKHYDVIDFVMLKDPSLAREYQDFIDYIYSNGIFGCTNLERLSKWILNDEKLLDNMLKCGYFLYEFELKENSNIYELETQVVFKRQHVIKQKVLHAKTILKEFLK